MAPNKRGNRGRGRGRGGRGSLKHIKEVMAVALAVVEEEKLEQRQGQIICKIVETEIIHIQSITIMPVERIIQQHDEDHQDHEIIM